MIITTLRDSRNTVRSSLIVEVPRQTSFHVPTGTYSSTIRSISVKPRYNTSANVPIVKFVFSVDVPEATVDYLAKIDLKLDLNEGSDLWNVLSRLIGRKCLQDASESTFDLNTLVGLPCDLEIEHVMDNAADHEFPLVIVANIQSAGTLVKEVAA